MEAACDIFYGIYGYRVRSNVVNDLLERLDFHALSITLLATTASHNVWDYDRLTKEWDAHRAQILRTDYNESLAATIELSLASPTFHKLGLDARDLLGVVAFYPQGIHENNLDWFFPTIADRKNIFDKFCALSLTYRNNGFITALAPIRDYLCPQDPKSSPLLCVTCRCYLTRLSIDLNPHKPGLQEARWIQLEDANIEHLLDVFTTIDADSQYIWDACDQFMEHLYWHKPRRTMLQPKIEGLPDDHPSKPKCLSELSRLFQQVGNQEERKRLLNDALRLGRERGDDFLVAETLRHLSHANRMLNLPGESIRQAKEALESFKRLGITDVQPHCLSDLALSLFGDGQLGPAEDAASRAIDLAPEKGQEFIVSQSHLILGNIYNFKEEREKAIHHFEAALAIASVFGWCDQLFWIRLCLARLFFREDKFDDASTHIERARSYASCGPYNEGRAMKLQAEVWLKQGRPEDAKSEALGALEIFEKLGAATDVGICKDFLRDFEEGQGRSGGESPNIDSCILRLLSYLSTTSRHKPSNRQRF